MKRNLLDESTQLNDWTCSHSYLQKKKTVQKSEQLVKFESDDIKSFIFIILVYYWYGGCVLKRERVRVLEVQTDIEMKFTSRICFKIRLSLR